MDSFFTVFEILSKYKEKNDWEEAFFTVIPKRKGAQSLNTGNPEESDTDNKDTAEELSNNPTTENTESVSESVVVDHPANERV